MDIVRGLRNFWRDPAGRLILGIAGTLVGIGTVFYHRVEDISWIDSLYMCVITLTTVGYGDLSPTTTGSKVFTMGYVVIGVGVFVALLSTISHHLVAAKEPRN